MNSLQARDSKRYMIAPMCRAFDVSKQAYYKWDRERELRRSLLESFALEFILNVRLKDPGIGGRKLWHMYRLEFPGEARLGRDRFESLIAANGLKVRKRPRSTRTTDSAHSFPLWPNLARGFIPTGINQQWVSDITYIPLWTGDERHSFCYLSLITDAYSREIIGWAVGLSLDSVYPIRALEMAVERQGGTSLEGLIHHSDRGVQYACREYTGLLKANGIRISMTENGDPKENAQAERVNSTIKNEQFKDMRFHSLAQVREALEAAVDFYNNRRPHMSLDMMTPAQAAKCHGEIGKRWHSYREAAIKKKRCSLIGYS